MGDFWNLIGWGFLIFILMGGGHMLIAAMAS